jgi:protein SCO1/2
MSSRACCALSLALVAAVAIGASACRRSDGPAVGTKTTTSAERADGRTSHSIYPLELALRDFDGETIGVDVFRGHPVVVSMFYGSCPAACPLIISHIKRVESSLPPSERADLRVLLVSFDAERDTPARLREIARAHRVDVARWRLAAGSDDAARQLANVLGVEYRKGEEGFFSHNSVISVLDRDGRVVARNDDPSAELTSLVDAVLQVER